ncbi:MAG TPA: XrtA system polysaccharide deacetylase [Planctomycetota bacterium]|nr:XrtA system polysaccharide deacetylase [Planctomycetota bacterium]
MSGAAATAPGTAVALRHALTVDVECWYHAENLRPVAPRGDWGRLEARVAKSTDLLLDLFDRRGVKATFFVLGDAAEREPGVVRAIAARGHEVACHGWSHELIYRQTPEVFRDETRRAKALLEDLSGTAVTGYRASTFSIVERSLWALDILADEGFLYDSSIAPVRHDRYGIPSSPRAPHLRPARGGTITEFPVSCGSFFGLRLPVGGGFFRLLPVGWTRKALAALETPGTIYLHPWEFDPDQPRPKGLPALNRFRHYVGVSGALGKLDALLQALPFGPMSDVLAAFPAR